MERPHLFFPNLLPMFYNAYTFKFEVYRPQFVWNFYSVILHTILIFKDLIRGVEESITSAETQIFDDF